MEASVGLRASNKARTRLSISDTATRLFVEHGFENVTVAQIAEAAQVSVKTVFNYFSSKEDLFFDRADDVRDALLATVRERPEDVSVLGALHAMLAERRVPFDRDGWRSLRDPERFEGYRSFIAAEYASPILQARRLAIVEEWGEALGALFAQELGDRRAAAVLAAMTVALLVLRERELARAMLARTSPRTVERRVRAVVDEGFERLARAFPDLS
ncbi:MAG TPA: helix-turn-helix domain-containing protein [Solirubrobacteraceae bacterium]|nr:helix-turn-helix domain-containing protein [Solirubrobacteraceae bacterium]